LKLQPFTPLLRFVVAVIIVILALYGLYSLLRPQQPGSSGQTIETVALSPVSRGEILQQFRLITVERQYRIPVIGRSYKPLPDAATGGVIGLLARDLLGDRKSVPGTTTNLIYEMVTTVTVGIDLAKISDADIQNSERETTITLPAPEVMAVVHDATQSRIFAKDSPRLPYLDNSATLLEELQRTGQVKHRAEAENDEALMARAETKAREALKGLLEKVHPGREVHILFRPAKKNLPPG
jgi:hypothetical protein